MELHDQIRIARERLGWDTATLAHKMSVSKTAVENWEDPSKKAVPHRSRLMKLQKLLGTTLYVTGTPNNAGNGEYDFSASDVSLLFAFHKLPPEQKLAIERIISAMAGALKQPKTQKQFISTVNHGLDSFQEFIHTEKKGTQHGKSVARSIAVKRADKRSTTATGKDKAAK